MTRYISVHHLNYVLFLVILYIFIYNPPFTFLPLSPIEVLLIPACLYITLLKKWGNLLKVFLPEIVILSLIILFSVIREAFALNIVFLKANIFLLLQAVILPYCLLQIYYKVEKNGNLLKSIILIGSVASVITLLMLFIPSFGDFVRYNLLRTDDFTELIAFRTFGLSEGLTFAYGTAQGLILCLVIYFSRFNTKYLLLFPLFVLSILFNARIGLIPVIFALGYLVILRFNVKIIVFFAFFCVVFYLVIFQTNLFSEYAKTIDWAFDFFIQSSELFEGSSSGPAEGTTFDILFGDMAVFPQRLTEWVVGSGENVFVSKQANSDIGYLIYLNYGGIIYLSLYALFVTCLMLRLRFLFKEERWFIFLLLVTILITSLKGLFISIIPSFRLLMLMYCYLVIENKKLKKNLSKSYKFNFVDLGTVIKT